MKADSKAASTAKKPKIPKQVKSVLLFIWMVIKIMFIIFLALGFSAAGLFGGAIYGYVSTAEPVPITSLKPEKYTSIIYDSKNNDIVHLSREENRLWVDYKDIPVTLVDAFVSIEDERFWLHNGVDFEGIAGVFYNALKPGSTNGLRGASTITQQLIKNITNDKDLSLKRKVQEQWRAMELEKQLSKTEIMELYLNIIFLGEGTNGVKTAAMTYFGKDVGQLNLAQCAYIAGITQNPTRYNRYPEAAIQRQRTVLAKMKELGKISDQQYKEALAFKIVLNEQVKVKKISSYSYFVDQVITDVTADLVDKYGWTKEVAQNKIFNGGLKIYMTQDPVVQAPMDEVFKNNDYFKKPSNYTDLPQGAMVIMEPGTGKVLALVGGRGEKKESRGLNRATQSTRQPGSSIKPIGVYAPAMEAGIITPGTVVDDIPVHMGKYNPQNYDHRYRGLIQSRVGVALSVNTVAVNIWAQLGADRSVNFLRKLGITTLTKDDSNASMALGGVTKGLTVMEMTGAYGAFVNRGIYVKPITYTKVIDNDGKVLIENKPKSRAVMSEQTAYLTTYMLQDVVTYGTGMGAGINKNQIQTAAKTGTTSNTKDKWFVGYTPYLVAAVWFGYDQPKAMPEQSQARLIWHDVMEKAHNALKLQPKTFEQPDGIVTVTICKDSGLLPGPNCSKDPRNSTDPRIVQCKYAKGTEPTKYCNVHSDPVKICKDSKWLANEFCPLTSVMEVSLIVRPKPFVPQYPGEAYPEDHAYELPAGEYCSIHSSATSPPTQSQVDPENADPTVSSSGARPNAPDASDPENADPTAGNQ